MKISLKTADNKHWGTPLDTFEALHSEFRFTVDGCANPGASMLPTFYAGAGGLLLDWSKERVFVNPSYGQREIPLWIEKAWRESGRGALVVLLLPSRTDTKWFHDYALKGEVRFIRGRLKFKGAKNNAPFPSMVVIFRGLLTYPDPMGYGQTFPSQ